MVILNREIMAACRRTISIWFNEKVKKEGTPDFLLALLNQKFVDFQKEVNLCIRKSINYHDENASFYHGFLAEFLIGSEEYEIKSNHENGDGRTYITVCEFQTREIAFVIEAKVADRNK